MHEEPFAQIAPITSSSETEEVLKRANDVPFGLAGYVFSRDLGIATKAAGLGAEWSASTTCYSPPQRHRSAASRKAVRDARAACSAS